MCEMDTSSIKKLEDLILVDVPQDLLDSEFVGLRRAVLRGIREHNSRWVVLDFSAVEICDSYFGRFVQSMTAACRIMGSDVLVAGLQDGVVETLVELGFELPGIAAVLDLDDAVARCRDAETAGPKPEIAETEELRPESVTHEAE
jgi:rsbT antagonist protein RsbS